MSRSRVMAERILRIPDLPLVRARADSVVAGAAM
jgi:hypothetical protein